MTNQIQNPNTWSRPLTCAVAAALLLLTSPSTAVQDGSDAADELRQRIGRMVDTDVAIDEDGRVGTINLWTGNDDDTYQDVDSRSVEVMVDGDDITVRINGKEVPAARISRKDGKVIVLDADGNELETIRIGLGGGDHGIGFMLGDGNRFRARLDRAGEPAAPPNVMLGIHLGEPGPALMRHLRLEPGTTTLINALYEGLPAHAAGLDEFDIITRIDGKSPADPATLRAVLAVSRPGDILRLSVIHEGEPKRVAVTLEAYDRAAMDDAKIIGSADPGGMQRTIRLFGDGQDFTFEGLDGFMQGMPDMQDMQDMKDMPDLERFFMDENNRVFEIMPKDGMKWFEFDGDHPRIKVDRDADREADDARDDDEDGSLKRLDRRLQRLEELLDELLDKGDDDE